MGGLFLLNNGTFEVLIVFNGEKRTQARTSFIFGTSSWYVAFFFEREPHRSLLTSCILWGNACTRAFTGTGITS